VVLASCASSKAFFLAAELSRASSLKLSGSCMDNTLFREML